MTFDTAAVLGIAKTLFAEAYEGPKPQWSWFTNVEPDAGVFGTIEPLNAAWASRASVGEGRSIAAHVEHLRWSLALVAGTLRGKPWNPDWKASWTVQQVNESQWHALRVDLRRAYEDVIEAIDARSDWSDPAMLTGVFALAPHAAHHLGTIRQIVRALREARELPTAAD